MSNILHKELSYTLNGILYDVHNSTGRFASEKQVSDCIEQKLKDNNIPYKREFFLPSQQIGEHVGRHRVDFLVDDKIIIEIK